MSTVRRLAAILAADVVGYSRLRGVGAAHVVALVKGEIEKPSDFDGVVHISLDCGHWRTDLGRELKAGGFPIDWNKVHAEPRMTYSRKQITTRPATKANK